jgi:hypothetical protein
MILTTSPTANKGFDAFVRGVATQFQVPPIGVTISVSFDPSQDYPTLMFSDPKPNPIIGICLPRREEARQMLMAEPDVSAYEKPKAAAKKAGARR